ncbi:MAG: hypothetical protein LBQ28_05260 [Prevotellaceae bacterium]|jgi:hypothetical protein|nr:hypothetical protein [Prevotellaceae bacterium]
MKRKRFLLLFAAAICVLSACSGNKGKLTPFAEPQEYVGEIPFENSKNVVIHFYLSADAKQITKTELSMDTLPLVPVNSGSGISGVSFINASVTFSTPHTISEGKISSDGFLVFDMTVTNECIYGNISIKNKEADIEAVTKSVYAVIPNITTPQEIPDEILKKNI